MSWIVENNEFPKQDSWGELIDVFIAPYPVSVFITNNNKYPYWSEQEIIDVIQEPLPAGILVTGTEMNDGFPTFVSYNFIPVLQKPYPTGIFITENDYPKYWGHHIVTMGAFNRSTLETAKIPISVKTLGSHSFADTLITDITISSDCTYDSTTFPENCTITKV